MATRPTVLPSGIDSPPVDSNRFVNNATSATLVAADTGKTYIITASGTTTLTLPATAVGLVYTMVWGGANGGGTIQFAPVAADGIAAVSSAVVNKALILAAATIKKGDYVTIASGVGAIGVTAWHVTAQRGILTKQP
jgi:hypothetical protein